MATLSRAAFLDRDGTLNRPPAPGSYVESADALELLVGAAEAVALLSRAGYRCVVVSNQRGVAIGCMTEDDLVRVDARLRELLAAAGAPIAASYYCTHGLDTGCDCRKPRPGLILRAARELGLDPGRSWMFGDSPNDVEAGRRAGCEAQMVRAADGALLAAVRTMVAHGVAADAS